MKKISTKFLCALCSVVMILSSVQASLIVFATGGDDSVENVVTSDVLKVEAYDSPNGSEDEIEVEMDEFVEGDEESPELSEDQIIEDMNLTNGVSEFDLGTIEEEVTDPKYNSSNDAAISDNPMDNSMGEMSEASEPLESDVETGLADPRFSVSSTNITINKGDSATVVLQYSLYTGTVKVNGTRSNSNVSGEFGGWYKGFLVNKKNLTIYGNYVGSSTVTVKFYDSNNKVLRSIDIKVTVKNYNYISLASSRADVLSGKSKSVNIKFYGGSYYSTSASGAGCSYNIKHKLGSTYSLNITGTNVGTTKITVYLLNSSKKILDSKTITVNTSKNASISPSSSSFSIDIGSSKAISFSIKNAYGNPYFVFSLNNSNCVANWTGSRINGKLNITGKKAGSTTITVRLYDSSNNLLGSTTVKVTIKQSPKITPSVTKVNLIPAQKQKVNFKISGYAGGVSAKYSITNKNVCGTSWGTNWSNNSINLTLYGYRQGTVTIKVYLYNSSGSYLTETSITVSVTGTPSIGTPSGAFSVNMGAQKAFSITAQNVATSYKLSYKTSGTAFSCSWVKLTSKTYALVIKGSKEGNGSITFTLKSEDGTILATKAVDVKINWVENPQITADKTNVSFTEGGSSTLNVSCTGTKKQFILSVSYSGKTSDPKLNMSLKSMGKGVERITFSCNACLSKNVTVKMTEASTGKTLASKTVVVDSNPNTAEFNNITYGTTNYSTSIPLSTFRYMYDTEGKLTASTLAKSMYKNYHKAGGVCYGFACTSMLFRNGTVSTSSFGASSIRSINNVDKFKNSTLNISARRFIEGMYIMQFSSIGNRIYNMQSMVNLVKNGNRILICIFGNNSGHALVGYKFDNARNRLYVVDCNNTSERRYIQLNDNYTSWSYSPLGWSGGSSKIFYQTMSNVSSMWSGRANYSYKNLFNTLFTNSTEFNITDVEGNIVASYSNGTFSSSSEDIYELKPIGYLEGDEQFDTNDETNCAIVLPTKFYVIDNKDTTIDEFEAEMVNYDYGVSVATEADQIAFGVDDSADLCNTSVTLSKGETYDITLLSSRDGEHDIHVEGQAMRDNLELGFAMEEGQLTQINGENASLCVDGEPTNYVSVEAIASEGGTISPNGTKNVLLGSDLDFEIKPNAGYRISDIFVNGESIGITEMYSLLGISEDTVIEARFEKNDLTVDGVSVSKNNGMGISWNPVKNAEGYEVFRQKDDGLWIKIADVSSDILDYSDLEIESEFTKYAYAVSSYAYINGEKVTGEHDNIGVKINDSMVTLDISKLPIRTNYNCNDKLDTSGMELQLHYADGSTETITSGYTCSPVELSSVGQQTITVMYQGKTTSFIVMVNNIAPTQGKVKSVSIGDMQLDYKSSGKINPTIEVDSGVKYKVEYKSSNTKVATVDNNGNVYGAKKWGKGTATITCTVTDDYGNVVTDTCNVTCGFAWWQWIIGILLFGWIWY